MPNPSYIVRFPYDYVKVFYTGVIFGHFTFLPHLCVHVPTCTPFATPLSLVEKNAKSAMKFFPNNSDKF